jgi:N-succinyldiaminopimelate aminotransferase
MGNVSRPALNRRLAGLGTTIFAEMSARAVATGSINLGQGFPDTDGPAQIARAAADAIMAGHGNQYPPGPGIPELRQAITAHQKRWYGLDYDPDTEVLVTAGATEAIAAAMLALVEPGDEVIAFEPYYDSYAANIAMAGGVRVPVTLRPPRFRPDLDRLAAAVTNRTRLILLNSPHNPTGSVFTRDELAAIAELAVERDLLVVADEVYEHVVFDGEHLPIVRFRGMRERTVSVSSAGKSFSFTGWKIGWITAAPELVTAVRTAKQFMTYVSGGPFQYAVAQALGLPDAYFAALRDDLRAKRDLFAAGLSDIGFEVYPPAGTYFVTTDISGLGETDGTEFCLALPERAGVVAIPSAVFYDDKEAARTQVRFAFCKRPEVLAEALSRLARLRPLIPPHPARSYLCRTTTGISPPPMAPRRGPERP